MVEHISDLLPLMMYLNTNNNIIYFITLITLIIDLCKKIKYENIKKYFIHQKNEYIVSGYVTYKNNIYYSSNLPIIFKSIMYYLYEKLKQSHDDSIKYNIIHEYSFGLKSINIVVFNNEKSSYMLTDKIKISQKNIIEFSEKKDFQYFTYSIQLSSITNNINDIVEFIDNIVKLYDEHLEDKSKKLKILTLNKFDSETEEPLYDELSFDTTKRFTNMFFSNKESMLKRIDFFENNIDRYIKLGIPHTLGFLFHGEPGTGKTSAIKALSHYTNRHIIIIPIKKINTVDKLRKIFISDRINDIKIPMNKRLYIFEDIDCSQWKDIVLDRKYIKNKSNDKNNDVFNTSDLVNCIKKTVNSDDKKEDKFDLCLGDILEVLDGVIEMPGRMIVMTSNHPDMLDPALLRPGRIDMIIEFKKLTRDNIVDMYNLWFDDNLPTYIIEKIPDNNFSQAEIGNIFSSNDKDYIFNKLIRF